MNCHRSTAERQIDSNISAGIYVTQSFGPSRHHSNHVHQFSKITHLNDSTSLCPTKAPAADIALTEIFIGVFGCIVDRTPGTHRSRPCRIFTCKTATHARSYYCIEELRRRRPSEIRSFCFIQVLSSTGGRSLTHADVFACSEATMSTSCFLPSVLRTTSPSLKAVKRDYAVNDF